MIVSARLVLVLALFSFAAQPVAAAPLTSDDLDFAFGGKTGASQVEKPAAEAVDPALRLASLQPLSVQEMRGTEGTHWASGPIDHNPGSPGVGVDPPGPPVLRISKPGR